MYNDVSVVHNLCIQLHASNHHAVPGLILVFGKFTYCSTGTRLCTKDHSNLYRKLEPYATKWMDIGKALGFKDQELSWILSTPWLVQQAPGSWLGEMLSQWLEWAPGDGRDSRSFATKESLHAALLKANLGNSLTDEFQ